MRVKIEADEVIIDFTENAAELTSSLIYPVNIINKNFIIKDYKFFPRSKININRNNVILKNLTCTCKNYKNVEIKYPKRDLRRVCKHIYIALAKNCIDKMDSLEAMILNHKFWYKLINVIEIEIKDEKLLIGYSYDFEIFYIYVLNKPENYFTYNSSLNIWKENLPPYNHKLLNKTLEWFLKRLSYYLKKYK